MTRKFMKTVSGNDVEIYPVTGEVEIEAYCPNCSDLIKILLDKEDLLAMLEKL